MPVRCIIEQVKGAVNFDNAGSGGCSLLDVEQDAFAILPVSTPLTDLVRTALARLGYSTSDAVCAKGAIQLKNWKPLSFDVITDDKSATIDDILRELKEYTLRIRLSSQPRLSSVDEMKEKLLQLLLNTSQSLLMDTGCPVEKDLLLSLSKGENFANVSEEMVKKFDTWYTGQISKNPKRPLSPAAEVTSDDGDRKVKVACRADSRKPAVKPDPDAATLPVPPPDVKIPHPATTTTAQSSSLPLLPSSSSSPSSQHHQQFLPNGGSSGHCGPHHNSNNNNNNNNSSTGVSGANNLQPSPQNPVLVPSKTRIRTSFDPEHEIPRLQKWFQENQHPSREQMVRYMSELNHLDSRKGRRPLDLTNIIYWFKNARAAQRRASKALDDSFENEENVDISNGGQGGGGGLLSGGSGGGGGSGSGSSLSSDPPALPPYLPNKNAVYIVPFPYHASHASPANPLLATPDPLPDSNDEPCDLSIKKLKVSPPSAATSPSPSSAAAAKEPDVSRDGGGGRCTPGRGSELCHSSNGELNAGSGSRSTGSHSRKGSPAHLDHHVKVKDMDDEDHDEVTGNSHSSSSGSRSHNAFKTEPGSGRMASSTPSSRKDPHGDLSLLEKRYLQQQLAEREGRLVMDVKEETNDVSDEDSFHSTDTDGGGGGRLRIHDEDEVDYAAARARSELGLSMGQLAAASESSAASMAALSLAQMSQPPLQIPMNPLNPLAMYWQRYYPPPPPSHHHPQSSAAATAAMVAAFSTSAHMNGHMAAAAAAATGGGGGGGCGGGGGHSSSPTPGSSSSQGSERVRPIPIQPAPHHAHSHPSPISASAPGSHGGGGVGGGRGSSEPRKRRTRVFIDPLTEIPKLEKWFIEDTHPSAYMIDKYTETLNSAEYRHKFPKLEPKNIQLWFKNHRAKVKRQKVGDDSVSCDSPPPSVGGGGSSGGGGGGEGDSALNPSGSGVKDDEGSRSESASRGGYGNCSSPEGGVSNVGNKEGGTEDDNGGGDNGGENVAGNVREEEEDDIEEGEQ